MELEGQRYLVKPMNCPFHVAIYRSRLALVPGSAAAPVRSWARSTATSARGCCTACSGSAASPRTTRHLFVREDQIAAEMEALPPLLAGHPQAVRVHRRTTSSWRRARRASWASPPLGTQAEAAPPGAGERPGCPSRWTRGVERFTGRRSISKIKDAIGREWQCATFQLDFQLPQRFELEYVGRRRPPPPAGDDPPGAAGIGRALHRRPDRALRGRLSAVAGAGAGPGAVGQREGRGLRQRGGRGC